MYIKCRINNNTAYFIFFNTFTSLRLCVPCVSACWNSNESFLHYRIILKRLECFHYNVWRANLFLLQNLRETLCTLRTPWESIIDRIISFRCYIILVRTDPQRIIVYSDKSSILDVKAVLQDTNIVRWPCKRGCHQFPILCTLLICKPNGRRKR